MPFASLNPTTGETLETFEAMDPAEVQARLERAERGFAAWRRTDVTVRGARMRRLGEVLEARCEELAGLMTEEMGKPIAQARAEAGKCAWVCRFYAAHAATYLADEAVETEASRSFVRYEPLGPVLAVMPWNFPFWQVFRFAAPALMAGNVALLKHAPSVPRCALRIEALFEEAGFEPGVFQNLFIEEAAVDGVLGDPRIRAATLTGSVAAGGAVGASAARRIKKTVLELGGSDPFIVMPSADLERAAATAVRARTINSGQSCIAAKRIIVAEPIADEFERRFVAGMEALAVGDPADPATEIGPLATRETLEGVAAQVEDTLAAGARLLTGGHRPERPGFFYPPTVLADVPEGSRAWGEEVFGPVASLFRVPDADAAIRLANGTEYGLGAAAWTEDPEERERFADGIEAGAVFINGMVASDPRLPFGGVKSSGYGRELGEAGIREFVNVKTVWVGPDAGPPPE